MSTRHYRCMTDCLIEGGRTYPRVLIKNEMSGSPDWFKTAITIKELQVQVEND